VNLEEYHALQRVEREHWFYRGKRDIVRYWIAKARGPLTHADTVLDAGAGTGEFVRELLDESKATNFRVIGLEYESEARKIGKETNKVELLEGSILNIPLPDGMATVSCALDVLEHVEDDKKALAELLRVTKSGGLVIINVPAFMSLWSDWDVTLRHFRRYTKSSFRPLLEPYLKSKEIEIVYLNYINSFAFPLILAYRAFRKFFPTDSRAEDKIPSPFLNKLLYASLVGPAKLRWLRAPFGVSLFAVVRKS
jgi:ubiquinone/menaquinone biosynthesis C-methylase UbiE